MNTVLLIVAIGLTSEYALVMLILGWTTRLILLGSILGLAYYAMKRHEKHHRSEAFDGRLTIEHMDQAREWLIGLRAEQREDNP